MVTSLPGVVSNISRPGLNGAVHAFLVSRDDGVLAAFDACVTRHRDLGDAATWLRDRVVSTDENTTVILGTDCGHIRLIKGVFVPLGVQVVPCSGAGSVLLGDSYAAVFGEEPQLDQAGDDIEASGRTIVVATDASWGASGEKRGTWAAVSNTGSYEIARVQPSRRGAEEQALVAAYRHWSQQLHHRDDRLVLLSDCQDAIAAFTGWLPNSASAKFCIQRTEARWVRGHAGHPLNDAADRLARSARRMLPAKLPPEYAERIVQPAIQAYAEAYPHASGPLNAAMSKNRRNQQPS